MTALPPTKPSGSLTNNNTFTLRNVDTNLILRELQAIPGIRIEPSFERPDFAKVELPRNTWSLKETQNLFRYCDIEAPSPYYDYASAAVPPEWKLYPHQVAAVDEFFERKQMLLGDVMGLGKTRTSIACMELVRRRSATPEKPVVIVAPKFLRDTWKRELGALLGGDFDAEKDFCALEGRDYKAGKGYLPSAKWIFIHYEILYDWWSFLYTKRPLGCIADEIHLCKGGEKTQRGKGIALMASALQHKLFLSGTPILTRPGEFYNLLRLIQNPWSFGTPSEFRVRYAGAYKDGYGYVDTKPTHTGELEARTQTCYIRRTLDDAGINLPPLVRENVAVTLDELTMTKYRKLLDGIDPRTLLDAFERGLGGTKTLSWLAKMRKLTTKAKMPVLLADLEAVTGQGEKAVVFVWQRETAEDICAELAKLKVRAAAIHGGLKQEERDALVRGFQDTDDVQVIVATYGALSVGVTLHRARTVYLHDLEWVPATMLQAEARVYRIGQSRNVISKWLICENTLDEILAKKIQAKAKWVSGLLGDSEPQKLAEHVNTNFAEDELENDVQAYLAQLRRA